MFSWSSNLSQISLKNSFGKVVFQILAEIEMTRDEIRLFGRHFETVQIFHMFFPEIWLWLVYIYMWHDQGEWFTCRQFSILIFQYETLVHLKCYILIQTPSQSDIWFQRYEQFFNFKINVKHKNLSPLSGCNSKSIFLTSDSFPLIMSHIWCKDN